MAWCSAWRVTSLREWRNRASRTHATLSPRVQVYLSSVRPLLRLRAVHEHLGGIFSRSCWAGCRLRACLGRRRGCDASWSPHVEPFIQRFAAVRIARRHFCEHETWSCEVIPLLNSERHPSHMKAQSPPRVASIIFLAMGGAGRKYRSDAAL